MKGFFGKFLKISLCLTVFLLPLFWLPFSFETYELNKTYLLFFLVSLGFLVFLAKAVFKDKEINFQLNSLDISVFLFLLSMIASSLFSLDKNASLFGFYGNFSKSLVGIISFGIFYFLIRNTVRSNQDKNSNNLISSSLLTRIFLFSCFFVILATYFSIFGIWEELQIQHPLFLQRIFNPVAGSFEGLAIFLAIAVSFLVGLIISFSKEIKKIYLVILLFLALGLLIIIDFNPAWITLLASLSIFLVFSIFTRLFKNKVNLLLVPISLIIVSTLFLFIDVRNARLFSSLPSEALLDQKVSWEVAFKVLKKDFKTAFLGSGIGTWYYDFVKEKPVGFNQSNVWDIRFSSAGNHASELFATTGIFGIFSYLLLIGVVFLTFFRAKDKERLIPYRLIFLSILIAQILYSQNVVLAFSFWFILGLIAVVLQDSGKGRIIKKSLSFKNFPELSLIPAVFLIIFSIFLFGNYYFLAKIYLADVAYAKAVAVSSPGERIVLLEKAVGLNQKEVIYRTALAKSYSLYLLDEMQKPLSEQNSEVIQLLMLQSINQAKRATEISPGNIMVWETLGAVYRDLQFLSEEGVGLAIDALQKAIEIEDTNPILQTEIGKLYLGNDTAKAKESFARAKELKPDYLDALFQEALLFEAEGNLKEAIFTMEELVMAYPENIEIRFQLGRLYFNDERIDEAIFQFETALSVDSSYSNALYFLGMAYEKKGETELAILLLERVLQLNPDVENVIQKLEELKGE